MEYRVGEGMLRGKPVFQVIRGSENTGMIMEKYSTREAAEELLKTLEALASDRVEY